MMAEPALQPDVQTIRAHLAHLTARWHELGEPVLLETVCLTAYDKAQVREPLRWRLDQIDEAAEFLAGMNVSKLNAYATVNPVRGDAVIPRGLRASAEHIAASFFHFADADTPEAAENIRRFVGPRCTFFVLTGTVPCQRPHVYWELEEPTRNLPAWSATQKAIAAALGTDSVTDAPRIMRLAGTINWPKPQKAAKGYIPELTALTIYDPDIRPPVSSERMALAFMGAERPLSQQAAATGPGLHIDTGPRGLDVAAAVQKIMAGVEWHNNVRDVVGHLIAKGLTDEAIHALTDGFTLPGHTIHDTRAEVQVMIEGGREKGYGPKDEQFREFTEEERAAVPPALFRPWRAIDLAAIPHPEFIYSDFYARGYTSVTLAAPKVGKSMLGMAESLDMATGRGFLTGVARAPLKVVYYNAEDDQDVIDGRVAALLTHYGIPQSEIEGRFFPTSGVEAENFYMVAGQEPVINEALFISLEKFCEAEKADAFIFDPLQDMTRSPETNDVFRLLGQRLRRFASQARVAVGLIHHTRKVAPGLTPTIDDMRGGSALRGTARFNRILVGMTEAEAANAGVANHRHFFRVGDVESNLAPPSADVNRWFEKVSVPTPNGHSVGAVTAWAWPDIMDGVSTQDARKVQLAIAAMPRPPRENVQSKEWAGHVVVQTLGLDLDLEDKGHRARVQNMLAAWIKSGVLAVEEVQDTRAGRPAKIIIAGPNNPVTVETFE